MMAAAVTVDLRHCCKDHLVTDDSEESWACMARIRRFGEQMLASVTVWGGPSPPASHVESRSPWVFKVILASSTRPASPASA